MTILLDQMLSMYIFSFHHHTKEEEDNTLSSNKQRLINLLATKQGGEQYL